MNDNRFGVLHTKVNTVPDQARVLRFVGTTGIRDRMGDEVELDGWVFDDYMRNPAFIWAHNYSIPPIGRTLKIARENVDGVDGLVFDVEFTPEGKHELADQLFDLAKSGFLPATSVGFQSLDSEWIEEDKETRKKRETETPDVRIGKKFKKKKLLELSLVPIGANPQALMVATKGLALAKEIVDAFPAEEIEQHEEIQAKALEALDQREPLDNGTTDNMPASDMVGKPGFEDEEGWKEIKYRVRDPGAFQPDSFRRKTMQESPPVVGIFGRLKGETSMTLQALRFPKPPWTVEKARAWVKEHLKALEEAETKAPLGWEPPPPAAKPADAIADTQPPAESAGNEASAQPAKEEPESTDDSSTKGQLVMADEQKTDTTADTLKALVESVKTLGDSVSKIESRQERLVKEPALPAGFKEKKIPTDEEIAEKRKEYKAARTAPNALPPEEEFSFVRMARAQVEHDWSLAPYEKWCLDETIKQKTVAWASGSAGGFWVGTQFLPDQFYMDFVAQLVSRKAGIQVISCEGAPVEIPRISAGGTVYWPGQNANITESAPTPNHLQLTPKQPMSRVQISKLLMQTSAGAAETYVRREIARRMAQAVDYMVLRGPGTSNKPTGLAATASINTVAIGTNGGALLPSHIFSMVYSLELDNVPMDGCVWVFHPRTWNTFRQTVTGADTYAYLLWQNVPTSIGAKEPPQLLGYPVYTTTNLSVTVTKGTSGAVCAQILFANFKECILAEWGAMAIDATDVGGNAWPQNAIEFRAVYSFDVGVRDANAVCLLSDSTS